jgi:hypothetical protein
MKGNRLASNAASRQLGHMWLLLLPFLVLAAVPASAQDGRRLVSAAHGFEVMLPEGFVETHADPEMSVFASADGTREILVLGGTSLDPLEDLALRHMGYDTEDGWTARLLSSTPSWVAYAGTRNGMQMVVRMIEVCPRWQYARLQVTYPERDAADMTPILDRLAASFRATGAASCPN